MIGSSTTKTLVAAAWLALASSACLDPLVSDEVPAQGLVLPAGTSVPSAHDDPDIEDQIDGFDGVDQLIPRLNAFAEGLPVRYWDFGPTVDFAAPLFSLARRNAMGELESLGQPSIIGAIPGDSGYSPYWTLLLLEVTEAYNGELITSFAAIEEAQTLGLIMPPVVVGAVDCPIVASGVRLEVGGGVDPIAPPSLFYWQGKSVVGFNFGGMPVARSTDVLTAPMYVISREGQLPLSEMRRGVDITGDSDTNDSNNVFAFARSNDKYTPLCKPVDVTVPSDFAPDLIDTTLDETMSQLNGENDMFIDSNPIAGTVVAFEEASQSFHCVLQRLDGAL